MFPSPYGPEERDAYYKKISFAGWGGASGHDVLSFSYPFYFAFLAYFICLSFFLFLTTIQSVIIAYDALLGAEGDFLELVKRGLHSSPFLPYLPFLSFILIPSISSFLSFLSILSAISVLSFFYSLSSLIHLKGVLHGGDNDTTGVMACAWWGALHGFDGVPERIWKNVEYRSLAEVFGRDIYNIVHPNNQQV